MKNIVSVLKFQINPINFHIKHLSFECLINFSQNKEEIFTQCLFFIISFSAYSLNLYDINVQKTNKYIKQLERKFTKKIVHFYGYKFCGRSNYKQIFNEILELHLNSWWTYWTQNSLKSTLLVEFMKQIYGSNTIYVSIRWNSTEFFQKFSFEMPKIPDTKKFKFIQIPLKQ